MHLRHSFPRISGAWTRLLTDWLDRENLDAPDIRAQLDLYSPDDEVPLPTWLQLLASTSVLCPQRPALGLEIGGGFVARHMGVLAYLLAESANLRAIFEACDRYASLAYGICAFEPVVEDEFLVLKWHEGTLHKTGAIIARDIEMAALVSFYRRHVGPLPASTLICFAHRVEDTHPYEAFFGCELRFGEEQRQFRLPLTALDEALPQRDAGLFELLDRQAQMLLEARGHGGPLERELRKLLLQLLPQGEATIGRMAERLNQTPRTLQRRLADSGLTWRRLMDRTREQLARQYLQDRSRSLAEISLLLGYAEQSAFTRAFQRWTGITPLAFRSGAMAE